MREAAMGGNRILKLGKKTDFACHMMEHQLGAVRFARFATMVWGIPADGKTQNELAKEGVEALAAFIKEIGLPTTLSELGIGPETDLKEIADSCLGAQGAYGGMSREEILNIFQECL